MFAIQEPKPAILTFTNEALMFVYLMLGDKCLRSSPDPQTKQDQALTGIKKADVSAIHPPKQK